MLSHLPEISRTIQGMGILTQTQRPFVQFLIKNWPLTIVAGFALFAKGRERLKKGDLTTYNVLADAGLVLSPLVGLALINQLAAADHAAKQGLPIPADPTDPRNFQVTAQQALPVSATLRPS